MTYQPKTTAVTVGTFDGYHRGHQAVIDTLRAEAGARCLEPIAIGFDRHPLSVICPERAPRLLCSPWRRRELIRADGVRVLDMEFNREAAALTAREYLRRLRDRLGVGLMVIGYDNTFGSDGLNMSVADYIAMGKEEGIEMLEAPLVKGISSSAIRKAVAAGDVVAAREMLGRNFSIEGDVIHGHAVGHTLGFPTANLRPKYPALLPKTGVYAGVATLEGGSTRNAIIDVGIRPTLGNSPEPQIEAHLLDYSGDLYGHPISLAFLGRLRDEKKFDSKEQLKEAIAADQAKAREEYFIVP